MEPRPNLREHGVRADPLTERTTATSWQWLTCVRLENPARTHHSHTSSSRTRALPFVGWPNQSAPTYEWPQKAVRHNLLSIRFTPIDLKYYCRVPGTIFFIKKYSEYSSAGYSYTCTRFSFMSMFTN